MYQNKNKIIDLLAKKVTNLYTLSSIYANINQLICLKPHVKSAKILLVPRKYEIFVGLFSIAPHFVIALQSL